MPKCRSCGAEIVWMITKKGRNVPVNLEPGSPEAKQEFDPAGKGHVSHFRTCPNAEHHSKGRR